MLTRRQITNRNTYNVNLNFVNTLISECARVNMFAIIELYSITRVYKVFEFRIFKSSVIVIWTSSSSLVSRAHSHFTEFHILYYAKVNKHTVFSIRSVIKKSIYASSIKGHYITLNQLMVFFLHCSYAHQFVLLSVMLAYFSR